MKAAFSYYHLCLCKQWKNTQERLSKETAVDSPLEGGKECCRGVYEGRQPGPPP